MDDDPQDIILWRRNLSQTRPSNGKREDMNVFLVVRRKKATVFLDVKENSSLREPKMMIAGITKVEFENQNLYKDEQCIDDNKPFTEYGLNGRTANAQAPATVGPIFGVHALESSRTSK